jgi:hypothetical protein
MRTRALWLLPALLVSCVTTTAPNRLRFTGEFLNDGALGISVGSNADKTLIAVVSQRYRYGMILPYAEDWEFFREGDALLRGYSGQINVTLQAYTCQEGPEAHLADKRKMIETNLAKSGLKKMELVRYKVEPVLRNELDLGAIDPKYRGASQIHYFVAKRSDGVTYEFHLSVVVGPEERARFDDTRWLKLVAIGFSPTKSP